MQRWYVRSTVSLHLKRTNEVIQYLWMINKDKRYVGIFYPEGKPIFHLVAPNIMGEEQNVSVLISQAVELLCQSDAIPLPTLTWLKDGRPLLKKPGISVAENGSVLKVRLYIHSLLPYHSSAHDFGITTIKVLPLINFMSILLISAYKILGTFY